MLSFVYLNLDLTLQQDFCEIHSSSNQIYHQALFSGNWLTALLMFSPWMYMILRVESLKSKYGLLFSSGGNDIYHFFEEQEPTSL